MLTIVVHPESNPGDGRIWTGDGAIDCKVHFGVPSGTCSAQVAAAGNVTVHADAATYSKACYEYSCPSSSDSVILLVSSDTTYGQFGFLRIDPQIAVSKLGPGTGTITSNPSGISCGSTCSAKYFGGTSLALTAVPGVASTFSGWDADGPCSGSSNPTCSFTVIEDASIYATFMLAATPPPSTPAPTAAPTAPPTTAPTSPGASPGATPARSSPKPTGGPGTPRPTTGSSGAPSTSVPASPSPSDLTLDPSSGPPLPTDVVPQPTAIGTTSFPDGPDPTSPWLAFIAIALLVVLGIGVGIGLGRRGRPKGAVE
jgi:hypothetical protein